MSAEFDPYFKWLSIPPEEQPANHYRLLGIPLFVEDADVIDNAAEQRMMMLRTFQSGAKAALSQRLLNEVAAARRVLLTAEEKQQYDKQLRAELQSNEARRPRGKTKLKVATALEDEKPKADKPAEKAESPGLSKAAPKLEVQNRPISSRSKPSGGFLPAIILAAAGGTAVLLAVLFVVAFSGRTGTATAGGTNPANANGNNTIASPTPPPPPNTRANGKPSLGKPRQPASSFAGTTGNAGGRKPGQSNTVGSKPGNDHSNQDTGTPPEENPFDVEPIDRRSNTRTSPLPATPIKATGRVQVFVLAGQSNMQGRGRNKHLLELVQRDPAKYGHLRRGNAWVERSDVVVVSNNLARPLRPGLGDGNGMFGPALGFGHMVGEYLEDPVVIVKVTSGRLSLKNQGRPPSSGGETGEFYNRLITEVPEVLQNMSVYCPEYADRKPVLAGFVWFQGWNDVLQMSNCKEYESNMTNLIMDLRRDWKTPDLKVVIAEFGMHGILSDSIREDVRKRVNLVRDGQAAVEDVPEFAGRAKFVPTAHLVRKEPRFDPEYLYYGNAENFYRIGDAMGKAMIELYSSN